MTEYVLQKQDLLTSATNSKQHLYEIYSYASFIKTPLSLGLFVPCDLDGNFLNPPIEKLQYGGGYKINEHELIEYKKAEDRVVFSGIEYVQAKKEGDYSFLRITELGHINYPVCFSNQTIEDLIKYKLKLTDSAKRKIALKPTH